MMKKMKMNEMMMMTTTTTRKTMALKTINPTGRSKKFTITPWMKSTGTKHYGGRFEHKLRRKGPNAVASDRAKLTTTRLQTKQKKRTCSEINRDVDRNKRSIQPLVNEIYTSGVQLRGSRRNTFEPDADATKRLSSKDGEGANVYAVLDFISYGDSNPKVVREVMSAAEV